MKEYEKDWRAFEFVEVRHWNQTTAFYYSLADAVRAVGWGSISLCRRGVLASQTYMRDYRGEWFWAKDWDGDDLEFRDETGLVIPLWRVREEALREGIDHRSYPSRVKFTFRRGPVVHLRKGRRWRRGSGYRHMKTTQERRENDFVNHFDEDALEYGVKSRGRRRLVPHAWDDICRFAQHSWKKHRRHQWRC